MKTKTMKIQDYRTPEYISDMKKYVTKLKSSRDSVAVEQARQGLIRTGVAGKNGHLKKKIVSWE